MSLSHQIPNQNTMRESQTQIKTKSTDLYLTVPTLFRCPISMDVMKSPVSLSTGVTYDRASIQKWLESHNTCPATMQILQSTDVIPNLNLRRLIRVWSDSALLSPSQFFVISKTEILDCVKNITGRKSEHYVDSLTKINEFASRCDENRAFLANFVDFVPAMIRILNVDESEVEIEVFELIISVFDFIKSEPGFKRNLRKMNLNFSPFVLILRRGDITSRIKSARVLESIVLNSESHIEKQGLLYEIYHLVEGNHNQESIEAGLSALISLVTSRSSKKELIRFGIVKTLSKILNSEQSNQVIEKALMILETVSTCTEGRSAIGSDENCVGLIVQKLIKVSNKATEHGITVIWGVCYMSRDNFAQKMVMKNNGFSKVLLVMQSGCSGTVKQMCGDLVKVFRVNSKSCLASYETMTTHIMPY